MARQERQALTIAPRYTKPANFGGTDAAWRALCEVYPSAETPEVVMAVVECCSIRKLDPYKASCPSGIRTYTTRTRT